MSGVKKLAEKAVPSALSRVKDALFAPWTLTGPASSPENLPSLTTPDNYRPFAPGSPPVQVSVPHGRPETTFDIKYFTRERRRVHQPLVNLGAMRRENVAVPAVAPPVEGTAAAPGVRAKMQEWHLGKQARMVPLIDDVNGGYT